MNPWYKRCVSPSSIVLGDSAGGRVGEDRRDTILTRNVELPITIGSEGCEQPEIGGGIKMKPFSEATEGRSGVCKVCRFDEASHIRVGVEKRAQMSEAL